MVGGLSRQARRAYEAAGMLFKLHLDLLYQCDLDCEHCYLDDKKHRILPTSFWFDVLDQAAGLGIFSVIMSGGEVLLRKDLFELVAHARRLGIYVHLKSHGGHIDRDVAQRLAAAGVTSVTLSYYATEAAIHDAITRRPGSHARTRAALAHLVDAGIITVASCAVMQRNRDAWRAVVAECEAIGVQVTIDRQIESALSGDPFPKALGLHFDDAVALEGALLSHEGGDCGPAQPDAADWASGKNCTAGHSSLYVSPEGDVTPCVMWRMPLGNLARGDRLAVLWQGGPAVGAGKLDRIRATRRSDRAVCATCEVRDHCDFCAGQSFVENGDPNHLLIGACEKTRAKTLARAAALGLPAPPLPAGLRDLDPDLAASASAPARPRFNVRAAPPRS